jgi:hypothetical protein
MGSVLDPGVPSDECFCSIIEGKHYLCEKCAVELKARVTKLESERDYWQQQYGAAEDELTTFLKAPEHATIKRLQDEAEAANLRYVALLKKAALEANDEDRDRDEAADRGAPDTEPPPS